MSWVTRVRNAIPFIAKRETAETLWHKCKGCNAMIFLKEFEENQSVCPKCDHHGRIGPAERFAALFDNDSYTVLAPPVVAEDPLKFRDTKKYVDRIKAARVATGEQDAMMSALGKIDGQKVVISVQDFAFMGGSMGMAVGEAFVDAAHRELAYADLSLPLGHGQFMMKPVVEGRTLQADPIRPLRALRDAESGYLASRDRAEDAAYWRAAGLPGPTTLPGGAPSGAPNEGPAPRRAGRRSSTRTRTPPSSRAASTIRARPWSDSRRRRCANPRPRCGSTPSVPSRRPHARPNFPAGPCSWRPPSAFRGVWSRRA